MDADALGVVTLGEGDRAAAIAAVKAALAVTLPQDDALIAAFAETALGLAEQFLGQALIAREMVLVLPAARGWQRLAVAPVRAITAVAGRADDGTPVALPPIAYEIEIDARAEGWVRVLDTGGARTLAVRCRAGRAEDWAGIPAPLRQGVVLLAAYLYAERDTSRPPPGAITALWRPYRTLSLGVAQ
ncbi:hypothetical protein [Sphingomonas sp.]|uniref:head-tail connector protein n=1 Tax=Sphingomonas sp. TaxID=28214 RepID=UPI001E0C2773|nr:hypothetical protein [Sphingomonas sp.]MBX9796004.1 hypothetical protein [Sphingomonas sp.]